MFICKWKKQNMYVIEMFTTLSHHLTNLWNGKRQYFWLELKIVFEEKIRDFVKIISKTEICFDLPTMNSLIKGHAILAFLGKKLYHAFNFSSNKWDFFIHVINWKNLSLFVYSRGLTSILTKYQYTYQVSFVTLFLTLKGAGFLVS